MAQVEPLRCLGLVALLAVGLAQAQTPSAPAAPEDRQKACAALPPQPVQPLELTLRGQCVLTGMLPSARPVEEARELARQSLAQGEPTGACVLYAAFDADPEQTYLRGATPDPDAYRRLARRPVAERGLQIEAIDALGAAAAAGRVCAMILLAEHLYTTVAPQNVERLRLMTQPLLASGKGTAVITNMDREATGVLQVAAATKLSVRHFLDAYRQAGAAAVAGYAAQTGGQRCDRATVKAVRPGEIAGAEYLPLRQPLLARSYLLRGKWVEQWTFDACGQEVPVRMTFEADGGGGVAVSAQHDKGH